MALKPIVVDFETEAIEPRPKYPPVPVGVAILRPGKKAEWYAWGHPSGNNCTKAKAAKILKDVWRAKNPLLFHNAKFDLDVAETHFGLPLPAWDEYHDTLFTLFLKDPHALSLSLKPAAEKWLGMPPEERDAVRDWLVEHRVITANQNPGPFIAKCPGDLVGKYAIGDVVRTLGLHDLLYPQIIEDGMGEAYDRERKLLPILLENEREGMRVDVDALEQDIPIYEQAVEDVEIWLKKKLKVRGDLNFDADKDVAEALKRAKIVTEFTKTKTGRDSVSKKNLTPDKFKDPEIFAALGYRNRAITVLSMSMRPWLEMAQANKGYIVTEWNQVRQSHGNDGSKGARTGRLSCSRFMNITKDFMDKNDGYFHPTKLSLPALPLVRKYILPDPKQVFCHRDYSQQEFRILAHFEDGPLMEAYRSNPKMDKHNQLQADLEKLGHKLARGPVKILGFGRLYGMGAGLFAAKLNEPVDKIKTIIKAMKEADPGVTALDAELKRRGREGEPIHTWGGRVYHCEPPKMIDGVKRTFEYKLLNYLVQGSAADCTKEAVIRFHEAKKDARFMVTVHDEINFSAPPKAVGREMKILKDVMASVEFDVPMLSDGKTGPNWGTLTKYEDETKIERKVA